MSDGIIHSLPLRFIRFEAAALFAFSVWLFASQHQAWWLFPALLLMPDLSMVGYLVSPAVGAVTYNIGHSAPIALALLVAGAATSSSFVVALGAIWLGHIGFDRALGYGLKYADSFKHTHLSDLS